MLGANAGAALAGAAMLGSVAVSETTSGLASEGEAPCIVS